MSLGLRSVRCLILQLQCSILLAPSLVLRRHGMRLPEVLQLVRLRRCLELRHPLVLRLVLQVLRLVPLVLLHMVRMLLVLLPPYMRPPVRVLPHTPPAWIVEPGCEV